MSLNIIIPTPLRKITGNVDAVQLDAATVEEVIQQLEARFPGFRARICDETGGLRRFINIYVDGEDVRFLDNLSTRVSDKTEVSIVPAIAGG